MLRAPDVATAMGLVLGVLAIVITVAERLVARRAGPAGVISGRQALRVSLRGWRWPSFAFAGGVVVLALVAPVSVLAWWVIRGTANGAARSVDPAAAPHVALRTGRSDRRARGHRPRPAARLRHRPPPGPHRRDGGRVGRRRLRTPRLVTAFALVTGARGTSLYTTFALLIAAYVLHFGGQALRAAQAAVAAVPSRTGEAARLLGAGPLRRPRRVELPLMVPGLAAGAGLVMLSVLKELPATLIWLPSASTRSPRTSPTRSPRRSSSTPASPRSC